jgi:hypothetical protein
MRRGSKRERNWGIAALTITLSLAVSSSAAWAADPLLSGYAAPGGGEQVLIGSKVLPAESGDGGLRRQTQATFPSADSTPTEPKRKAQRDPADATDPQPKRTGTTVVKPTYPNRIASASAVPVSGGDVISLIGAGAVLGAVALFFRRGKNATT